ncbi:MAG: prepilin-type N-terminal cleavage/methylation domain-containing protein [Halioglobus sp.]|nr:prepilin-type N-terminal cleavage/methylation domain-containing protein [Halioglobus sp.]
MSPAGSRCRGFTLLELVAAISIAALLLGISAPAVQRLYDSARYRSAVSDVVAALNAARYTAIRQGRAQDVLVNPVKGVITRGEEVRKLPASVELEVLGSRQLNRTDTGVIRFYPDGGSSGGFVNVAASNGRLVQVQVDWLLGHVSLCKQDCREL